MPTIGPLELGIVAAIALIIFGPKRLPSIGRSVGSGIRELRSAVDKDHDETPKPVAKAVHEDSPGPSPEERTVGRAG